MKKEIQQLLSPKLNQKLKIPLNQVQNSQRSNVQKMLKYITQDSRIRLEEDIQNGILSSKIKKNKKHKTLPHESDGYRYHVDFQGLQKYSYRVNEDIDKSQKLYRGGFSFDKAVQTNFELLKQDLRQYQIEDSNNEKNSYGESSNDDITSKYFKFSERSPNNVQLPHIKSSLRQIGTIFSKADRNQDNANPSISPGPGKYEIKNFTEKVYKKTNPKKKLVKIMSPEELRKKCMSLLVPAKVDITINQERADNLIDLKQVCAGQPFPFLDRFGVPIFPLTIEEKLPGPGEYFVQQSSIQNKLKKKKNLSEVKKNIQEWIKQKELKFAKNLQV